MTEKKNDVSVNLVKKAVGQRTEGSSCCSTAPAGTVPAKEAASSCCGGSADSNCC